MNVSSVPRDEEVLVEIEEGGWRSLRRSERDAEGASPATLLARTALLPGNERLVPGPGGTVVRLTEAPPELEGEAEAEQADREDAVATALAASGLAWSRRGDSWVIPATLDRPWELRVRQVTDGVRVEALLTGWDEGEPRETDALARFLVMAQSFLRCARCELAPDGARVVSHASLARLETDLGHSLRAVMVGCRLLAREARALTVPEVGRGYLRFHEAMFTGDGPVEGQPRLGALAAPSL